MLQIVIWMLCVYMVLKGKDLQFTAAASPAELREQNVKSANRWATVAIIAAILFFLLSLAQGNAIPDAPRLPTRF